MAAIATNNGKSHLLQFMGAAPPMRNPIADELYGDSDQSPHRVGCEGGSLRLGRRRICIFLRAPSRSAGSLPAFLTFGPAFDFFSSNCCSRKNASKTPLKPLDSRLSLRYT